MSTDRNLQLRTVGTEFFHSGGVARDVKITAHTIGEFGAHLIFDVTGAGRDDIELGVELNRSQAIALIEVLARIINGAEQ
jgi:hypothetical protein